MYRLLVLAALFGTLILTAVPLRAQEQLYVQSAATKVMAAPSLGSKVLAELRRGSRLVVTARHGSWAQVRQGRSEGYVPAFMLAPYPPMEPFTISRDGGTAARQDFRARASASVEVAPEPAQPDVVKDAARADYDALAKMESLVVTDDDIAKFGGER